MTNDTIFALSSGRGRAALAVLRVSGPQVPEIFMQIIGRVPEPRRAILAKFKDPGSGELIDRGLALFFPGPKSETGEDCGEFHSHGGSAIIAAMLRAFAQIPGTRLAEPGEFVRRAFENGKLDLTAVEGLADLVEAETEAQRRQALRQAEGLLGAKAEAWRKSLIEAAALVEADIDFADEGDVAASAKPQVLSLLEKLRGQMQAELTAAPAGERLRDGVTIVVAGPPNAGKSTLINALARRDVAIVSDVPGTTRDAIEVRLDLGGLPATLIDTAGLHEAQDKVEAMGMARTHARAAAADLVLWLSEVDEPLTISTPGTVWQIGTKSDLGNHSHLPPETLAISAATGANMDALIGRLTDFARDATAGGEGALITNERHRRALVKAAEALDRTCSDATIAPELLAEDLRYAIRALESLIGRVDVEDILGEIFARFCIGK
jgi:tRNA modification GTPase